MGNGINTYQQYPDNILRPEPYLTRPGQIDDGLQVTLTPRKQTSEPHYPSPVIGSGRECAAHKNIKGNYGMY
jgi:hypothetical protein